MNVNPFLYHGEPRLHVEVHVDVRVMRCRRHRISAVCSLWNHRILQQEECQLKDWKDGPHKMLCKMTTRDETGKAANMTDADKRRMGRIKPELCDLVGPVRVAEAGVACPAAKVISRLLCWT